MEKTIKDKERVLLIGFIQMPGQRETKMYSLEELSSLIKTAGGEVVEKIIQRRDTPDAAFFIGKGKVQEIKEIMERFDIDTLAVDEALSPVQLRNLGNEIGKKVVDRRDVILDIFALHAKTRIAKIEVELAQLKFRLPRLHHKGVELSRLGGGIGTRGPGEQKLEIDRRRIKERIRVLERKLDIYKNVRTVQKKSRKAFFLVAIVGYTNAGKSTLLNKLTHTHQFVDDKLFATLDSKKGLLYIGEDMKIILVDTIGFIRNIPTQLIASFYATLKEAITADLRLIVVDVSDPQFMMQLNETERILSDLSADKLPKIIVFNKIDRAYDDINLNIAYSKFPDAVFISAKTGKGIEQLKEKVSEFLSLKKGERLYANN